MRLVPAFLIAPIPVVIVQTMMAFNENADMRSDWRAAFFPIIALAALWVVQLLIGIPITLVMRRNSWIGVGSFAVGGAIMMIVAGAPFWIRLLMIEDEWAHRIHRFMLGMAIEVLLTIARWALFGAFTGMFFYWLARGRHHPGEDLDALRQRFE